MIFLTDWKPSDGPFRHKPNCNSKSFFPNSATQWLVDEELGPRKSGLPPRCRQCLPSWLVPSLSVHWPANEKHASTFSIGRRPEGPKSTNGPPKLDLSSQTRQSLLKSNFRGREGDSKTSLSHRTKAHSRRENNSGFTKHARTKFCGALLGRYATPQIE